jgi:RimJ/RimL family protein N-acetyltransferase
MLKGKNVILRAVERDDLKALHDLEQNVDLVLLGDGEWQPVPLAKWEKDFDKELEGRERSWFAIEVGGTLIGSCGLHHSHRRDGSTQFGIGIYHPEYIGKGHGRDAIAVLLRWAFLVQNWRRVWLETLAENERAIHCYRAVGFVEEGRLREQVWSGGRYEDIVLMALFRSDFYATENSTGG